MASLCSYAHSEEVRHFASALKEASDTYWHMEVPETFEPGERDAFAPGAFDIQLPIPDDAQVRAAFAEAFGTAYDVQTSRLLLPLELEQEKEFAIQIECTTAKTQMLDRGIQNLILNVIEQNRPGSRRIYYLDAARYNSAASARCAGWRTPLHWRRCREMPSRCRKCSRPFWHRLMTWTK